MERRISFICITGVLAFISVVQTQDPRGTPGVDYPNYFAIPETSFKCSEQKYNPGFYADSETKCQVFHFCYEDRQESFLCPTGAIFNQAVLTCDVWYNSNCSLAQMFYSVNDGPIMEKAGKNLPMLLRLRNHSQKKSAVETFPTNVLDKISSLYETNNKTPNASSDSELKVKIADKSIESSSSDFDNKDNEQMVSKNRELDSEEHIVEETARDEFVTENEHDEDVDTNMMYDNIEDGYHKNYGQYDREWQNSEPVNEEFGNFYDYRDSDEYGDDLEYQVKYYNRDTDSVMDYSNNWFAKRSQPGRLRVRRKPVYVVLDDQPEVHAGKMTKRADKLELNILAKSETEDKQINLTELVEETTPSPESFPRPTAIPHSLLNIASETPMTSDEFESAIWSDLILPGIPDDYNGPNLVVPDNEDSPTQFEGSGSPSDAQSDDETIYIENDIEPESYVPYVSQYEDVFLSEPGGEQYSESYSESRERTETDLRDTDDTFVVIPDEYDDNVLDSVSSEDDFEMQNFPEETEYRAQMLEDRSLVPGYDTYESHFNYENTYSSDMGYPHYQNTVDYPEMNAGIYRSVMQNDQRYDYETGYELPRQLSMNYETPGFEAENVYSRSELYPYAETEMDVTERYLEHPMSETDLGSLSNEDFAYVLDDKPEVTWETAGIGNNLEFASLVSREQMNPASEIPSLEPFTHQTAVPHSLLNIPSETPMASNEFESTIWSELISPEVPDDFVPGNKDSTVQSENTGIQSGTQIDDETVYTENLEVANSEQDLLESPRLESGQPEDLYYVFDFDEQSGKDSEIKTSEDEKRFKESSLEKIDTVDEQNPQSKLVNSLDDSSSRSNASLESERHESTNTDSVGSTDYLSTSKDEQIKSPDVKTTNINPINTQSSSNLGHNKPIQTLLNTFSSNMDNFDFSTDSRFLNNIGYPESMNFGPYGFGSNMRQFSMIESSQHRPSSSFSERLGQTEQPRLSPLSAIQEKMRSMKQGKFGAFKKYMSSTRK